MSTPIRQMWAPVIMLGHVLWCAMIGGFVAALEAEALFSGIVAIGIGIGIVVGLAQGYVFAKARRYHPSPEPDTTTREPVAFDDGSVG